MSKKNKRYSPSSSLPAAASASAAAAAEAEVATVAGDGSRVEDVVTPVERLFLAEGYAMSREDFARVRTFEVVEMAGGRRQRTGSPLRVSGRTYLDGDILSRAELLSRLQPGGASSDASKARAAEAALEELFYGCRKLKAVA